MKQVDILFLHVCCSYVLGPLPSTPLSVCCSWIADIVFVPPLRHKLLLLGHRVAPTQRIYRTGGAPQQGLPHGRCTATGSTARVVHHQLVVFLQLVADPDRQPHPAQDQHNFLQLRPIFPSIIYYKKET
jgi:hypothetical protein